MDVRSWLLNRLTIDGLFLFLMSIQKENFPNQPILSFSVFSVQSCESQLSPTVDNQRRIWKNLVCGSVRVSNSPIYTQTLKIIKFLNFRWHHHHQQTKDITNLGLLDLFLIEFTNYSHGIKKGWSGIYCTRLTLQTPFSTDSVLIFLNSVLLISH